LDLDELPGNQGMLPGVAFTINMTYSKNPWRLVVPDSADTEKYKLIVK
jgi:hypothetical protein